jgi:hypothetical protein
MARGKAEAILREMSTRSHRNNQRSRKLEQALRRQLTHPPKQLHLKAWRRKRRVPSPV